MKAIKEDSRFRFFWDLFLVILIIISCFLIPFQIAFVHGVSAEGSKLLYFIDLYFILDVILNFFTSYRIEGVEVQQVKQISRHYLKTYFPLDLLASFPIDALFLSFAAVKWNGISMVLLLRVFRLLRIVTLYNIFHHWEFQGWSNAGGLRIIKYFLTILVLIHWVSCLWFLSAFLSGFPSDSWVVILGLETSSSGMQYLRSLYWAVTTMTTVGYGDITPSRPIEYLFSILTMLLGASMYALIIGNIASLFSNIDAAKSEYVNRIESITQFLRHHRVSPAIIRRVRDYYQYLWEHHRGGRSERLFQDLPAAIRVELMQSITIALLDQVSLFKASSPTLQRVLISALKLQTYTPDIIIAHEGEIANEIFFISQGSVEVFSNSNPSFTCTLELGEYFGDLSIILNEPRTASVKTLEYCEIFILSKQDFNQIKSQYPEFREVLKNIASQKTEKMVELLLEGITL